jgi:hypothetical protein
MFPPFHQLFVDDFASIVLSGLDVDGLLDDCIRSAAEGLSRAILCAKVR